MMEEARTIVAGNKVYRPLLDDTVTEEDWKKSEIELNETPESRAAALTALKKLLAEQTDFVARTDDSFLLRFLRVRKFNIDRAFKLMKDHYTMRSKNPDIFPPPSSIEKALKANIFNLLAHRDHLGRVISLVKIARWDPSEISYSDFVAAGNLTGEYVLDNVVTQINGYIGIWDFKDVSMKQYIAFCSPSRIFLVANLLQNCFPGRMKSATAINCTPLVQKAWNICRVFVKEKFRKRIQILASDLNSLHEVIDPSILPREYGGEMPPSDCLELAERILKNEQYFNYNREFGYKNVDDH